MRRSWILVVCLATGFTTLLDQAILTVAVPDLRLDLDAGRGEVQWILAAYSLAFGVALVPAGRLGDAVGRGRLLVGGLVVFSLSSLIGATAQEPWVLVVARLLQGVGAGTANPQVIGLVQDHFEGAARTRALGGYAAVASVAGAVAPLIGGVLLAVAGPGLGWRLVVAVNVPFGLATAVLASRVLRSRGPARSRVGSGVVPAVDPVGILLLTALTLTVLLPVVGVGAGPYAGVPLWVALGLLAGVTLWRWEKRVARAGGTPILLPALARSRGFVLGTLVAMCWFGAVLGSGAAVTLFLQEGLGLGPLSVGVLLLPSAVAAGVSSALAWRVVGRFGRPAVTWSLVALGVVEACALVSVLSVPRPWLPAALVVTQTLAGVAGGLITAPNQGLALAHAPAGAEGLAAGFFQVSQRIAATLTLAACSGVLIGAAIGPGDLAGYRSGLTAALGLTLALVLLATLASALETKTQPIRSRRLREAVTAPTVRT